jgi:uncharacterized RDD family membrane protein YckC
VGHDVGVTFVPAPADVPGTAEQGAAASVTAASVTAASVTAASVTRSPARHRARPGAATEARPADPGQRLAGRWRRLAAFAIDAIIMTLVTGALWGRLLASFANRMSAATSLSASNPAAHGAVGRVFSHTVAPYLIELVATIIVAVVYYWLLTGYWGTTIGKRSLGMWVVRASDGSPAGLRRSLVRALVFVVGGEVVPLFFLADNGWLLASRRRQALHDKAAATLVVRDRPGQSPVQ